MNAEAAVLREDLQSEMEAIGAAAKAAAAQLAIATTAAKNAALEAAAAALRAESGKILEANARDMAAGRDKGLTPALLDRLELTPERIEAMAQGLEDIARLPDPVGRSLGEWERPNGLKIARVAVPLGVVGIIYESRPNVTADAGGLCLKSGNAAILRGGSEAFHSAAAILDCLQRGLAEAGLPAAAIQRVPTSDRAAVGILLRMSDYLDIVVPRGGKGLIERVQQESRMPVLAHLEGLCHTYVDGAAELEMARAIAVNAKLRRTGICGATETLLVDRGRCETHLAPILDDLIAGGCEMRGDPRPSARSPQARVRPRRPTGTPSTWRRSCR